MKLHTEQYLRKISLKAVFPGFQFFTKKTIGRSGTGLGLTVVWNTVQDHDGYIDVSSYEKGTKFIIYLPVTRDKLSADPENSPVENCAGKGEKILILH